MSVVSSCFHVFGILLFVSGPDAQYICSPRCLFAFVSADDIKIVKDSVKKDEEEGENSKTRLPIEDEDDDMKPLPAHHDDILLEFLGWPKSLQDLGQDDGNGFKSNEPNTDFIDPAFFFG